jgi:hypothetical protein
VTLVLVAALALVAGARVARWWLLILPVTTLVGAVVVLSLLGVPLGRDTPVPFMLIFVEAFLAVGVMLGMHRRTSVQ